MEGARGAPEDAREASRTVEVLYRLADFLGRSHGLQEICEAALEAICAGIGSSRASALLFDEQGVMRFVAWRGLSASYREAVEGHSPWTPTSRDPPPVLHPDVARDPELAGIRDVFAREGIAAVGFIPLVHRGLVIGKFMVYYDRPHEFSDAEVRLAASVARHVSFGVARVRAEDEIARGLRSERAARQEADAARARADLANRTKDEFIATIAHELRNPLSVISNSLGVLDAAAADPSLPTEPARALIRQQVDTLGRLLRDLLDVARVTSGKLELAREPLDVRTVIETVAAAQRRAFEQKRQRFALRLCGDPLWVEGDAARLRQVLVNLLDNACKYTPDGGWIELCADGEPCAAVLRVRDSGAGIEREELETVFDLFRQLDTTRAHSGGGLGIGLRLVKRIVELHGGTVVAQSEGRGHGSEFVVRIPTCAPPA